MATRPRRSKPAAGQDQQQETTAVATVETAVTAPAAQPPVGWQPKSSEAALIKQQMDALDEVFRNVLKKDTDYGIIPGTQKPCLYKPGAEKIGVMFSLGVQLDREEIVDLGAGHREVRVTLGVFRRDNPEFLIGFGVGSCATLETKYRYRQDPGTFTPTDKAVRSDYWAAKERGDLAAMRRIAEAAAGKGAVAKKIDGLGWVYCIRQGGGEKIENPDIAETWNTVRKMAKKRAFVDAMITCTAGSERFTQDLEDFTRDESDSHVAASSAEPAPAGKQEATPGAPAAQVGGQPADGAFKSTRPARSGDARSMAKLQSILDTLKGATAADVDARVDKWSKLRAQLEPSDEAVLAAAIASIRGMAAGPAAPAPRQLASADQMLEELKTITSSTLAAWLTDHSDDLDAITDDAEQSGLQQRITEIAGDIGGAPY